MGGKDEDKNDLVINISDHYEFIIITVIIDMNKHLYRCIEVCISRYIDVYTYLHIYIHIHVYIYICVCIYIYI